MEVLVVLVVIALLWIAALFFLGGSDLSRFDGVDLHPDAFELVGLPEASEGHFEYLALLKSFSEREVKGSFKEKLAIGRAAFDELEELADLSDIRIQPVDIDGVAGEWVLAGNADPDKRLVFLHGGGFMIGGPRGYRAVTTLLARKTGCSVLVVDYRLMPEHRRLDCFEDVQTAYRWALENGPEGQSALKNLYVVGDSAGGTLTLSVVAWARDQGLRSADAVVAMSPQTDAAFSASSLATNLQTDHLLGPVFKLAKYLPRPLLLLLVWWGYKARPYDARISPVRGDLANLPPILIHASENECLVDDSRRYVNKAIAAGTQARLETWRHVVHCWQIYGEGMREGVESYQRIADFLNVNRH